MDKQFKDKVAIISGGSDGIGLAVARQLGSEGCRCVLAGRHKDKLDKAVNEVGEAGAPDVWGSVCDVAIEAQVEATVAGALQRYGRIDVIVNSAGLMEFKPIIDLTTEDWQKALGVDLLGAFYFIRQAFIHMKPGGSIVNVSSIHAHQTSPLVAPYAAAKAALNSLTRSAAIEGKPLGIRVNAVLPGAVDTDMLWDNPNIKSGAEKVDKAMVGQPDDVAATIVYLASGNASFVQGAEIRVDGGRLARL